METSIDKIKKRTSCYIPIANWSYKAYSLILKQEPQSQCLTSQTTCTVKHILIECKTFAVIRKRVFKVNNLTDLFENVKIDNILSFLRGTELYQKYDNLKLVNLVQTNEMLLIENSTYLNIRFEIFGWICIYIYIYIDRIWRWMTYKGWYAIKPKQPTNNLSPPQ